jgi:putative hydrolase of the HAD superfamily
MILDHLYYILPEHLFIVKRLIEILIIFGKIVRKSKGERMDIRAVYFDFGGVLYNPPDRRWMRRWLRLLRLENDPDVTAMIAAPENSAYVQAVMEGRISEDEFWQRLGQRWRFGPTLAGWMRRHSMHRRRTNHEVADFLGSLRPRYKTAILSNAGTDARRTFTQEFGFHQIVDEMIISAELGVAKPDERIYRIALERFAVLPEQAIFVDDLAANVAAARRLGMHAVQFRHTRQALDEVKALLEPAGPV